MAVIFMQFWATKNYRLILYITLKIQFCLTFFEIFLNFLKKVVFPAVFISFLALFV